MHRDGKPKGFFYLDHRTVDSKANIITDVFVTLGNTNDVKPYINRLDTQIAKFGFEVETVGLDAGYNVSAICKQLFDRGINAAMGTRRGAHQKGKFGKYKFKYIKEWDVYICPERNYLEYTTTNRQGYKEYKCKNGRCEGCPNKERCLSAKAKPKHSEDMFGRTLRMSFTHLHIPISVKRYTQREKNRSNEASPIQKNCSDYAIAECVVFQRLPSNACLRQPPKI